MKDFNPDPKPGKKKKKKKNSGSDPKYVKWIKKQACCNPSCVGDCGQVTNHHARILGNGGTSLKPPDKDSVPLGKLCHDFRHNCGAITFWGLCDKARTKIVVQALCDDYYNEYLLETFKE